MKSLLSYILLLGISFFWGSCSENDKDDSEAIVETTYPIAEISTRQGTMYFWLYDETPNHKAKFVELANNKHYDQFTFNRVVNNFVIQGGCPDSAQYFEDSPYLLEPEFVDSIKHIYGALGIGRNENPQKLSNACQFYIVSKEAGLPNLDGNYMIIGKLLKGDDVLEAIEHVEVDSNDTPLENLPLTVRIESYNKKELRDSFNLEL